MADSDITKRALAAALKSLVEKKSFAKITVSDVCEMCGMNRKSFYYHFKDKYDLVNWIYETECVAVLRQKGCLTGWELLDDLCAYFYANRTFYRATLLVEGQNSFSDYLWDFVVSVIKDDVVRIFGAEEAKDFFVDFYADAYLAAIKRWLLQKDCMPADQFVEHLKHTVIGGSHIVMQCYADDTI